MKKFHVERTYLPLGTSGVMRDEAGAVVCYTVERPSKEYTSDHPCVDEATYILRRYNSPAHGPGTWEMQNVPGRTHCQIHIANWPHQLLGCVAPGVSPCMGPHGEPGVNQSEVALTRFKALTEHDEEIAITFSKAPIVIDPSFTD